MPGQNFSGNESERFNMKLKNLRDAFMFMKVLSAGLVVAGYAFLGVWVSNWLSQNGWPLLISLGAIPVIAGFGMWQAWLFLTKDRKNPSGR